MKAMHQLKVFGVGQDILSAVTVKLLVKLHTQA